MNRLCYTGHMNDTIEVIAGEVASLWRKLEVLAQGPPAGERAVFELVLRERGRSPNVLELEVLGNPGVIDDLGLPVAHIHHPHPAGGGIIWGGTGGFTITAGAHGAHILPNLGPEGY